LIIKKCLRWEALMTEKFELHTSTETVEDISIQIIKAEGYLDSSTFNQLQELLEKLVEGAKYHVIVEFGNLNYISSAGLGVLMGMLNEFRNNDGDLKLANMSPKVRNLFDMLGFSRLIRIFDSCEDAKNAFIEDRKEQQTPASSEKPEDEY
jgi:anti-sigma B factor antagonist